MREKGKSSYFQKLEESYISTYGRTRFFQLYHNSSRIYEIYNPPLSNFLLSMHQFFLHLKLKNTAVFDHQKLDYYYLLKFPKKIRVPNK